jgi:hypothetical protein
MSRRKNFLDLKIASVYNLTGAVFVGVRLHKACIPALLAGRLKNYAIVLC